MRLFWIVAGLLVVCTPSSAIFATLIRVSPTLAKMVMFGLGTMGPTFLTTGLVYYLGRHFGTREIRPKFRKPVKPGDRLDFGQLNGEEGVNRYEYYAPEESQYSQQGGEFAYVEGRSQELTMEEVPSGSVPVDAAGHEVHEEVPAQFTHPRGRKIVRRRS